LKPLNPAEILTYLIIVALTGSTGNKHFSKKYNLEAARISNGGEFERNQS
jgi:hypothetical protein